VGHAWIGLAAALLCAQGAIATARVEVSVGGVKVEAPATVTTGGWEVTVSIDPAECVVYCTYRKAGGMTLLPPVTTLRIFGDGAAAPEVVVVDPAGRELPVARAREVVALSGAAAPGRKWMAERAGESSAAAATVRVDCARSGLGLAATRERARALRI